MWRCRSCVCGTSFLAGTPTANALAIVCTGLENFTASMFANSSCHMKGAETSSFLGFVVVLADRWKHTISDGVMLWNAGMALDGAIETYAANRRGSSLQKRGRICASSLHDTWTSWPAAMCTQCRSVTLFCTLRTRPISSAILGSTRRSRTSPRTDGSP